MTENEIAERIEAGQKAKRERDAERVERRRKGGELVQAYGLKTVVAAPPVESDDFREERTPRMVACWRHTGPRKSFGSVIELSTALCHPKDVFVKGEGRYLAACSFHMGNRVKLVVPKRWSDDPSGFIRQLLD